LKPNDVNGDADDDQLSFCIARSILQQELLHKSTGYKRDKKNGKLKKDYIIVKKDLSEWA
jgi:hypothetical protein